MDIVKIKLWVPDQKVLNEILSMAKVSLDCGSPRRDESGDFVITLYAAKAEAKKIAGLKYRHESRCDGRGSDDSGPRWAANLSL